MKKQEMDEMKLTPVKRYLSVVLMISLMLISSFSAIASSALAKSNDNNSNDNNSPNKTNNSTNLEALDKTSDTSISHPPSGSLQSLTSIFENPQSNFPDVYENQSANTTVDYIMTAFNNLVTSVESGNITLSDAYVLARTIPIEKIVTYDNGTYTEINQTYYFLTTPNVNMTDAISQGMNPMYISAFSIINVENVQQYNQNAIAEEMSYNVQLLINEGIIFIKNFNIAKYISFFIKILNSYSNLHVVQISYRTTSNLNHGLSVTAYAIFNPANNSILYNTLTTNIVMPFIIKTINYVTVHGDCLNNQEEQKCKIKGEYDASDCGFSFTFMTYEADYDTTYTLPVQGFLSSASDVKKNDVFTGSVSGSVTDTATEVDNWGTLAGIMFIPVVGAIVNNWYLTTLTDLESHNFETALMSLCSSCTDTVYPQYPLPFKAGTFFVVINTWKSSAGSSSTSTSTQTYSSSFQVQRSTLSSDYVGSLQFTSYVGISDDYGALSNIKSTIGTVSALQYARNTQDPSISVSIDPNPIGKGYSTSADFSITVPVIPATELTESTDFQYQGSVTISIKTENPSGCATLTGDTTFSFSSGNADSLLGVVTISTTAIGSATIQASITSYDISLTAAHDSQIISASSPEISSTADLTILSATPVLQLTYLSVHDADIVNKEGSLTATTEVEPGTNNIAISAIVYNDGATPAITPTLDVWAEKVGGSTYIKVVSQSLGSTIAETTSSLQVNFYIQITTNGNWNLEFGFTYTFTGGSATSDANYNGGTGKSMARNDAGALISPTQEVGLYSPPTIVIGYLQDVPGDCGDLELTCKNPAAKVPLTTTPTVTITTATREYVPQTLVSFYGLLIGLFAGLLKIPGTGFAAGDIVLITKVIGYAEASEKTIAFFVDFALKIGFTVLLYYACYANAQSWPLTVNQNIATWNEMAGSLPSLGDISVGSSVTVNSGNQLEIYHTFMTKDPLWWDQDWIDYGPDNTGYSQVALAFSLSLNVNDQYGNTYTPLVSSPPSEGLSSSLPGPGSLETVVNNLGIILKLDSNIMGLYSLYNSLFSGFLITILTVAIEIVIAFFNEAIIPNLIINGVTAIFELVIALSIAGFAANDPDSTYTQVAIPVPYTLNYTMITTNASDAMAKARLDLISEIYGYMNASRVTWGRLNGAMIAQNETYVTLQANALIKYTEKCDDLISDLDILNSYNETSNTSIPTSTSQQIASYIQHNGITPEMQPFVSTVNESSNGGGFANILNNSILPSVNYTMVSALANGSARQGNSMLTSMQWAQDNAFLRGQAFDALSEIKTTVDRRNVTDVPVSVTSQLRALNESIYTAINGSQYSQLESLRDELNTTFWSTFDSTLNTSIVVYYNTVILANYVLDSQINLAVTIYPNVISFDRSLGQTNAKFSLCIYNTGFLNTTFGFNLEGISDGFRSNLTTSSMFLDRTGKFCGNYSLTLTNASLPADGNYNLNISVYSVENPIIEKEIKYSIVFSNYSFSVTDPNDNGPTTQLTIVPGGHGFFILNLKNTGNVNDHYTLQLAGTIPNDWMFHTSSLFSYPGYEQVFSILVQVPRNPSSTPATYSETLSVSSQGNPDAVRTIPLELTVLPYYEFTSSIVDYSTSMVPGSEQTINVQLQNLGNTQETYLINATNMSPLFKAAPLYITLASNETKSFDYQVFIPRDFRIAPGETSLSLNVTSLSSSLQNVESIQFNIAQFVDITSTLIQINSQIETGNNVSLYNLQVHNLGNINETFAANVSGINATWIGPISMITLAPNATGNMFIYVDVPRCSSSTAGNYNFNLQLYAIVTNQEFNLPCTMIVMPYYQLSTNYNPLVPNVLVPGSSATDSLYLMNGGNSPVTVEISITGINPSWFDLPNTVGLNPGQSINITGNVTPVRVFSSGIYNMTIYAFIMENSSTFVNIYDSFRVIIVHQVIVSVKPNVTCVNAGQTAQYACSVKNLGNVIDAYQVTFEPLNFTGTLQAYPTIIQKNWVNLNNSAIAWNYTLSRWVGTFSLSPGQNLSIHISITIPVNWAGFENATYSLNMNACLVGHSTINSTASLSVTVISTQLTMKAYVSWEIDQLNAAIQASSYSQWVRPWYKWVVSWEVDLVSWFFDYGYTNLAHDDLLYTIRPWLAGSSTSQHGKPWDHCTSKNSLITDPALRALLVGKVDSILGHITEYQVAVTGNAIKSLGKEITTLGQLVSQDLTGSKKTKCDRLMTHVTTTYSALLSDFQQNGIVNCTAINKLQHDIVEIKEIAHNCAITKECNTILGLINTIENGGAPCGYWSWNWYWCWLHWLGDDDH